MACVLLALGLLLYPLMGELLNERYHSDVETVYVNAIDRDKIMSSVTKNLNICLVYIVVDIWLNIEFISDFKSTIDVSNTTLVITIHIDSYLLSLK